MVSQQPLLDFCQYQQQYIMEAETAVRVLAEAIRGYQRGCPNNHFGKACGGGMAV